MQSAFPIRVKILSVLVVLISLLLIAKLFFVQVIHGGDYSERADRQYSTPSGNLFERGSIFFSTKNGNEVSAAATELGYKVAINPKQVIDVDVTYQALSAVVPLDRALFDAKVQKKNDPYEEVLNRITKESADAIDAQKIPGVSIYKEKWRFYPGNSLASRALGFIAYKGDELLGRYGLEREYNATLSRDGSDLYVNFFAELFSDIGKVVFKSNDRPGDIITTLEPTVQDYLERSLAGIMSAWHTDEAGGIIINPKTGEIYAMATLPDFDLNESGKVTDPSLYGNPLIENVYELGSVIKTLTMSAGVDAGVVTPDTTYDDKGCLTLNTHTVCNFDKRARGVVSMQEVLNQSLNTGATYVMQKLGKDRFREYMLSFGINEKTDVDMPGEVISLTNNLNSTREIEYATASYGQGIALAPIAAVRAFSAVANGGTLITPHLVKKIDYTDGGSDTISFPEGRRVIKTETSETVTRMLVKVVDTALFGGTEKLEHYSIAAKTGTAQIAKADGTGYYEDQYLHSMYGYFPAYDPKFLVFLYDINPKEISFAANTLGHPFINTSKFLLNYYEVAPDR